MPLGLEAEERRYIERTDRKTASASALGEKVQKSNEERKERGECFKLGALAQYCSALGLLERPRLGAFRREPMSAAL